MKKENPFVKLKYFLDNQKVILDKSQDEITITNLNTLIVSSFLGLILFLLCFVTAPFMVDGWVPTYHYYLIPPVLFAFFIFGIIYLKKGNNSSKIVQVTCILFYLFIGGLLLFLSTFSYPATSDTFVTLFLMIIPALFIMDIRYILGLISLLAFSFLALVFCFKEGDAVAHDSFATVASLLFSIIEALVICNIHIRDLINKDTLHELSEKDPLTKTYNRIKYEEKCSSYLKNYQKQTYIAMLIMDIDNFKKINDNFGHLYGDEIITFVANVLLENCTEHSFCARVGGDEFSIFYSDLPNEEYAYNNAKIILEEIEKKVLTATTTLDSSIKDNLSLTSSIGLIITKEKMTFDQLYKRADNNLYIAKNEGKNRIIKSLEE